MSPQPRHLKADRLDVGRPGEGCSPTLRTPRVSAVADLLRCRARLRGVNLQGSSKSAERRAALIISLPLPAAGFLRSPTAFRRSCGEEAAWGRERGAGCGEQPVAAAWGRRGADGPAATWHFALAGSVFSGLVIRFGGQKGPC